MRKILSVLIFGFVCSLASLGQAVKPSVSVIGEAELKIAPDQVVFTFEVVTTDTSLTSAKNANDDAAAKTLAVTKGFGISADDVQTDKLTVSPRLAGDKDPRGRGSVIGYEVSKRILVTLKTLDRIDQFLARVIEAGVNRIVDVSIENSLLDKYTQDVKLLAVDNAREKAEAYAKRLGLKVGPAYVIREEGADTPGYTAGFGSGSGMGDGDGAGEAAITDLSVPKPYSQPVTFALGKISVEDKIYVTFELLPR